MSDEADDRSRKTGSAKSGALPAGVQAGIERASGLSLNDVRVHRNSARPAQLTADAYAAGADIHLRPDGERHLPHEVWHIVQQRQGRMKPTGQTKGLAIDDVAGLEREADAMGAQAADRASKASAPRDN